MSESDSLHFPPGKMARKDDYIVHCPGGTARCGVGNTL